MKALDILVAARTRLGANKENWTVGALARRRPSADEGKCFCSIGVVLNEAGAIDDKLDVVISRVHGEVAKATGYGATDKALYDALTVFTNNYYMEDVTETERVYDYLSLVRGKLAEEGVQAAPMVRALDYLQAAARQIGDTNVINFNDLGSETTERYNEVLAMFDLAIRNAKRRHINGKRFSDLHKPVAVALP